MDGKMREEFDKLYPDRCKPLLDSFEAKILRAKINGKMTPTDFDALRYEVSMLKIRCAIFHFRGYVEMVDNMEAILYDIEKGLLPADGSATGALLKAFETLKEYFLEDKAADEKEIENLISNMRSLRPSETKFHPSGQCKK